MGTSLSSSLRSSRRARRRRAACIAISLVLVGACAAGDSTTSVTGPDVGGDPDRPSTILGSAMGKGSRKRRVRRADVAVAPSFDLSAAIPEIRDAYVVCVTVPNECDTSAVVATGSPAAAWLDGQLGELMLWNLARAPIDDGLAIRELVHDVADRATARVCIVNDLPLVDRREPSDPNDDIPFVNPLLSIMAHWELQLTAHGWRLFDVWPLGHFPESDTCEAPRD